MLKTFALRGREVPLTIYGPPGLRDLFGSLRRIFGKLTYPLELVELRAGEALERGDYAARRRSPSPRRVGDRLRARRGRRAPAASTSTTADALGVPNGPERGALQRGESVTLADGRVVTPDEVLGAAASRAARSCSRATRRRPPR